MAISTKFERPINTMAIQTGGKNAIELWHVIGNAFDENEKFQNENEAHAIVGRLCWAKDEQDTIH